ncbi:MAG TPA: energy transducer TonB [Chitinophagales bacterium]|nr:energy transducer TonB [Chitinophagales bacterium]
MSTSLLVLFICLLCSGAFGQGSKYELPERQTPTYTKTKAAAATSITDLSNLIWASMEMPADERYFLQQRRINEYPQPPKYVYPEKRYAEVLDYVSVEISAMQNGKPVVAKSNSDKLTTEQKNLLSGAAMGSDVTVKIKYAYKDQKEDGFGRRDKTVEGKSTLTLVPDKEAEFPGGFKQLSDYFIANVINKINDKKAVEKFQFAAVKFTINETGQVTDAKITRYSSDAQVNALIIDALSKMPAWKPAENGKGEKVKQEFSIPFNAGC